MSRTAVPQWRGFAEDAWNFDLSGFVHLPGLLGEAELAACRAALAARTAVRSPSCC